MAGNWITWLSLVPSSPGLHQCSRILCDQCLGISGVGREGPVGHQPSVPRCPLKGSWTSVPRVHWVQGLPAGTVSHQRQEIFFLRPSKGLCACSPHKSFSEIWHFQLNTMKRESTSNLSLFLLFCPLASLEKFYLGKDYQPFVAALNSPSAFELLRLSSPKGLGFSGKLLA